jgi:hypothetical protein
MYRRFAGAGRRTLAVDCDAQADLDAEGRMRTGVGRDVRDALADFRVTGARLLPVLVPPPGRPETSSTPTPGWSITCWSGCPQPRGPQPRGPEPRGRAVSAERRQVREVRSRIGPEGPGRPLRPADQVAGS